ncbi:MAG: ATP-binding protein, partial [Chitinivibrionales bacterium]
IKAGGTVRNFETVRRKKDGGEIPVSLTVSPVKTIDGKIIGASTITRDVTDQKIWERSLLDINERLLVSNQELENLGHTLSHDLRGPMQGIEALTGILLKDHGEKLDQEGKQMLNKVNESTRRIRDMISGLLDISRIARAEMRREKIDVSALVRAIAQESRKNEPTRDAEILIEDGLFAEGDAKLLPIALDNLIRNSWKFTGKREKTIIEFGKIENRGKEAFFLRDNGAGFEKKHAYKMFTVFQRLHSDSEFTGTGVGLATVQKIIRRHGGEIWAEGEIDKGATFYFTLS